MLAQPWHCDSRQQHLRHVTKRCACHENPGSILAHMLRLPRKTQNAIVTHVTIETDLRQIILSHFVSDARRRWGFATSSRTVANSCGHQNNTERTRLQPPNLQSSYNSPSAWRRSFGKVLLLRRPPTAVFTRRFGRCKLPTDVSRIIGGEPNLNTKLPSPTPSPRSGSSSSKWSRSVGWTHWHDRRPMWCKLRWLYRNWKTEPNVWYPYGWKKPTVVVG